MGNIETDINFQKDLTIHTVSGEIKAEEVAKISKLTKKYSQRRKGGKIALISSLEVGFSFDNDRHEIEASNYEWKRF